MCCSVCWRRTLYLLEVWDVPVLEVPRRVLLCVLEDVSCRLYLLEVPEELEAMRGVLLCMLEVMRCVLLRMLDALEALEVLACSVKIPEKLRDDFAFSKWLDLFINILVRIRVLVRPQIRELRSCQGFRVSFSLKRCCEHSHSSELKVFLQRCPSHVSTKGEVNSERRRKTLGQDLTSFIENQA